MPYLFGYSYILLKHYMDLLFLFVFFFGKTLYSLVTFCNPYINILCIYSIFGPSKFRAGLVQPRPNPVRIIDKAEPAVRTFYLLCICARIPAD